MRIYGPNGSGFVAPQPTTRRAAGSAFTLGGEEPARAATSTGMPRGLGGIDALIALQALEQPGERRRRAAKRGRGVLDALEEIKIALLAGTLDPRALVRLQSAMAELTEKSGDPGLDQVLAEIELRAGVELAKFARASPPGEPG